MASFVLGHSRLARILAATCAMALLAACEKELILEGERFDPRADLSASIAQEGQPAPVDTTGDFENRSVPISLPGIQGGDWTQRSGNARHVAPHGALSAAPQLAWAANIGSGNSRKFRISGGPVASGGRVFAMDAIGRVSAVSAAGATLWTTSLAPEGARGDASGGGIALGDARVFATSGHGEVVALDAASGAVVWRQKLDGAAAGAPTVDGGLVYVVGRAGAALALNAANGRVEWQFDGSPSLSGVIGGSSPAVSDTSVLFPFSSGEVIAAQKPGGTPVWSSQIAGKRLGRGYTGVADITGDPVVVGNVAYVGNQSGRTVALDTATGTPLWSAREAAYGPVLPVGGSVFLISDEAQLVRLDASTGERIWAVDMPYFTSQKPRKRAEITAHYGPVLAGGRLVVVSGDGTMRAFSAIDGSLTGSTPIPGGAASAPALAGGALYVVSRRGQLLAFR